MRTLLIFICLVLSVSVRAQDVTQSATDTFDQAIDLLEAGDYETAIPLLQSALEDHPEATNVLWNLGISALVTERYELSATTWNRYREVVPQDWNALPRLIQSHQGSGNTEQRDLIRAELIGLHESKAYSSLSSEERYCREQYPVDDGRVFVYEYFKPFSSERAKIYEFFVTDDQGDVRFTVSFGSYDSTNDIDLELGNHEPNERLYHFDAYYPGSKHITLGFVTRSELMSYDEARAVMAPAVARLLKDAP